MPLFEFHCPRCGKDFDKLVRSAFAIDEVTCPECGSNEVQKKLSIFASRIAGGASSSVPASSCSPGGT